MLPEIWTDDVVAALRTKFRVPSHSFRSIARDLNAEFGLSLTRCAVAGKVARLNLVKASLSFKKQNLPPAPRIRKRRGLNGGHVNPGGEAYAIIQSLRARAIHAETPSPTATATVETFGKSVAILDARADQCRWPAADDGSATHVCGDKTLIGSYCAQHYVRVWRQTSPADGQCLTR